MKLLQKIKNWLIVPYENIKRFAKSQKKPYPCERILGTQEKVIKFAEFYKEFEEEFTYFKYLYKFHYKNTAENFMQFFRDCVIEEKHYINDNKRDKRENLTSQIKLHLKNKEIEEANKLRKELNEIN